MRASGIGRSVLTPGRQGQGEFLEWATPGSHWKADEDVFKETAPELASLSRLPSTRPPQMRRSGASGFARYSKTP